MFGHQGDRQMYVVGHEHVGVQSTVVFRQRFLWVMKVPVIALVTVGARIAIVVPLDDVLRNTG